MFGEFFQNDPIFGGYFVGAHHPLSRVSWVFATPERKKEGLGG